MSLLINLSRATWTKPLRSSFARSLVVLTSSSLLQSLITFASAPIIARLFAPEDFGIFGLIQALEAIPLLIATGQYYLALGIARSRSESINIAALSMILAPMLALVLLVPALLLHARPELLPSFLIPAAPYLWVIPASMVASGVVFVTRLWEIRHAHYGSMVINRLIESSGIATAQIGLGLLGAGPLGLIFGRLFATIATGAHGLKLLFNQIGRGGLRAISLRRMRAVAARHWRFPTYQLSANALTEVARQMVPLLLALFYSLESVGFYWFANRLLERVANIWGSNVGRVFYQHAADRRRVRQHVSRLFWRTTSLLFITAIIPFGLVIAYGPLLFSLVFGADWEVAGHYARWIAFVNFVMLVAFPARGATALFDLQGIFAVVEAIRAVAGALALILVAMHGGGALLAVGASATAQSLIMLGFIAFVTIRLRQLDRKNWAAPTLAGGPQAEGPPNADWKSD